MSMVYAVASQKGGVSKTVSAINFGIALANKGYRVLCVDTDPQGSMTASLGFKEPDKIPTTLADIFEKEVNGEQYDPKSFGILSHPEGVDLIPCNIEMSGLEVSMVNVWSRELVLRRYLDKVKEDYDYIILDSMPSLGILTINVLAAADRIIIPVQAAYLSLKGLEQLIRTIGKVKNSLNSAVGIEGILITMLDNRTNYAREIVGMLEQVYGHAIPIFDHKIPHSVRVPESNAEGVSIFRHDPRGKVAEAYLGFAEEVLAHA